ncbi:MAG: SAVED domain-containing protein, partial [Rhodothermales bacterium]
AAFLYDMWHKRQRKKRLDALAGKTERPRALILSHGGGSIKVDVEQYLQRTYSEREIPVVEHLMGELTPHNSQKVIDALRQHKENFQDEGVTELHLFFKTTTAIAAATGAIFDNWRGVKVYQFDRNTNDYHPWLTLAQAKALPLQDVLAERVLEAFDPSASASAEPTFLPESDAIPPKSISETS